MFSLNPVPPSKIYPQPDGLTWLTGGTAKRGLKFDLATSEQTVYEYYHKKMILSGGSGDTQFFDPGAWGKSFEWQKTSLFSLIFHKKEENTKMGITGLHPHSMMAVEKLRFSGDECPPGAQGVVGIFIFRSV